MLVQLASVLGSAVAVLFQLRPASTAGVDCGKPKQTGDDNGLQASTPDASAEDFYGLAAWQAFCRDNPGIEAVGLWKRSMNRLKRVLPLTIASVAVLTGCGGSGGSDAPIISLAFSGNPPSALITSSSTQIAAVVNGDSTHAGAKWSVICGSAQCGTVSPDATTSGVDTTYTAPAAVPTAAIVTITATSVADPTKSVATTITINASQPSGPILSDGNYVYHYSGQDRKGLYFVVGVFTIKSGAITAGEQDFTDPAYYATEMLNAANSSLSQIGGNIQVVLDTGDKNIGINGVVTLRGAVVSPARALLSEFDTSATGSGALDLQTGADTPEGSYAFYSSGSDQTGHGLAIGGVMDFSSGVLLPANSVFDFNDNMTTLLQRQSFASGAVSSVDAFGRVTFSLVPSSGSGVKALTLTGYVNRNQIQLVESQGDALNAFTGGAALSQGTYAGTFSMASPFLRGASYAFGSSGMDNNGTTNLAGGLALHADGSVSGAMAINDIVNSFGFTITGGTYTVDPTGRVTLSNVTSPSFVGALTFQLYLDGNGNALELGVDTNEVTGAEAYAQNVPSGDFEGAYAFAAKGFWTAGVTTYPAWSAAGVTSISADSVAGFSDYTMQNSDGSFTTTPNVALSGGESNDQGLLRLFGLNAGAFQTESNFGYYPIDANRVIAIQVNGHQTGQQGMMMLEAVQSK